MRSRIYEELGPCVIQSVSQLVIHRFFMPYQSYTAISDHFSVNVPCFLHSYLLAVSRHLTVRVDYLLIFLPCRLVLLSIDGDPSILVRVQQLFHLWLCFLAFFFLFWLGSAAIHRPPTPITTLFAMASSQFADPRPQPPQKRKKVLTREF